MMIMLQVAWLPSSSGSANRYLGSTACGPSGREEEGGGVRSMGLRPGVPGWGCSAGPALHHMGGFDRPSLARVRTGHVGPARTRAAGVLDDICEAVVDADDAGVPDVRQHRHLDCVLEGSHGGGYGVEGGAI